MKEKNKTTEIVKAENIKPEKVDYRRKPRSSRFTISKGISISDEGLDYYMKKAFKKEYNLTDEELETLLAGQDDTSGL